MELPFKFSTEGFGDIGGSVDVGVGGKGVFIRKIALNKF